MRETSVTSSSIRLIRSGLIESMSERWVGVARRIFADQFAVVDAYREILDNEGILWGMIGPRETDRLWDRHILNSLCISPLIEEDSLVADLGSGAGLPGIPLAIYRPDLRVVLVEPMQRRVDFLTMCCERLNLSERVAIERVRGEDYRPSVVPDILTCRALTSVPKLLDMVRPLLGSAELLAIKGERADQEVIEAQMDLQRVGLTADVLRTEAHGEALGTVIRIRRFPSS